MSLVVPPGGRDVRVSALEPDGNTTADQWLATVYWDIGLDPGSLGAGIARARGFLSV